MRENVCVYVCVYLLTNRYASFFSELVLFLFVIFYLFLSIFPHLSSPQLGVTAGEAEGTDLTTDVTGPEEGGAGDGDVPGAAEESPGDGEGKEEKEGDRRKDEAEGPAPVSPSTGPDGDAVSPPEVTAMEG